jgi:hypothetical protein
VATRRPKFDSSLKGIYGTGFKKNSLAGEAGVRGFSKSELGFLLLMKSLKRSITP